MNRYAKYSKKKHQNINEFFFRPKESVMVSLLTSSRLATCNFFQYYPFKHHAYRVHSKEGWGWPRAAQK